MRKSEDIKGSKLKNILGLYIQVSTLHVYEYESREEKGSGQKGTNTIQYRIRESLRTNPLKKGLITVVKEGIRRLVFLVFL